MSESDGTVRGIVRRVCESGAASLSRSLSRYDLVLAVVPAAFLLGLLAGQVLPVPTRSGLTAASVVSAALIADGLFRRPPRLPTAV
jgi:hypothetical protein